LIRRVGGHKVYVGVISHKRAKNVPKMEKLCGPMTWYVGDGEAQAYKIMGATNVIESGGLCRSRNAILDDAFAHDLPAIELSDDLRRLEIASNKAEKKEASLDDAVTLMFNALETSGASMAGVAPTSNAFFFNPNKPIHTSAFVVGDFIMVKPTTLRFDEELRLKEDYDYTLQHLMKYGVIARCNAVLATFAHRTNKGGACDYRTSELEQQTIRQLKDKWPGMLKDNPKRKDEILLAI